MLINTEQEKDEFRRAFLAFLKYRKFNLMSFIVAHIEGINKATKLDRTVSQNYSLINQRLNSCKTIDPDFFQKLVHLVDEKMFIQKNRDEILISKRF